MDAKNPEIFQENKGLGERFPVWAVVSAALIMLLVILVLIFDWNWFRGPIARYASQRTGRQVRIGDLNVRLLSLHPHATITGLNISNPSWAPAGETAEIPKLYLQVKLWPLFAGNFVWEQVAAQSPNIALLRDSKGRATWEFGTTAAENAKPLRLPPIRRFLISNGAIRITDEIRRMTFSGTLSANQNSGAGATAAFLMAGQGMLNRRAFKMKATGGPLVGVERNKPYPFEMDVRSLTTHVTATASIRHPFDLGQLDGQVVFAGANLADLYYLTGIAFPRTSPYRLSAAFSRDDTTYKVEHMAGTVGNSDLEGDLTVDTHTGRPFLSADMHSRRLDFVDLGPLLGGAPSRAHLEKAAVKAGVSRAAAADRTIVPLNEVYLLPDIPLAVDRVNQMDAKIHYVAQSIQSEDFPLRGMDLSMTIDHGLMKADPISITLTQGRIAGFATVDARKKTPTIGIDIRMRDLKLQQFVAKHSKDPSMLEGTLEARAVMTGTGASLHKAASTANGDFRVVVPGGAMRQRFAELMGISVDRAFLLSGQKQTDLRCVVADFRASGGVMTARTIVFDTGVMNISGKGSIDMRNETMNIELLGHPKKLTLFRLRAPIVVSGSLKSPDVGIKSGAIPEQAGAAIALGLIATPLAAILPFIDPGLAKNADCAALEAAAPVASSRHSK